MAGQVLDALQRELLVEEIGNRRHAERVRREIGRQPSFFHSPLHHPANVLARHRDVGEPLFLAYRSREEGAAFGVGLRVYPR